MLRALTAAPRRRRWKARALGGVEFFCKRRAIDPNECDLLRRSFQEAKKHHRQFPTTSFEGTPWGNQWEAKLEMATAQPPKRRRRKRVRSQDELFT